MSLTWNRQVAEGISPNFKQNLHVMVLVEGVIGYVIPLDAIYLFSCGRRVMVGDCYCNGILDKRAAR